MFPEDRNGKIVTFYSFKGGVGRTMALANLAYLAAYHHKKVLVMDWDLEAPGLLYYFRGLANPDVMDAAKHSGGVLNILWSWYLSVTQAESAEEMDSLLGSFRDGRPFQDYVHSIADPQALPQSGDLHYMSAGSPHVYTGGDEAISYAQALSTFPWHSFYDESAGGALINLWRSWAKENYDLILVDSRTGLADVAGLCTMQMPDEVALCLVLNRQNIDGSGRVAASIRDGRGDEVALRALPMRVARADTSEESDARARAFTVLTKVGGFSAEHVLRDFSQLSIPASENVPFYETLAPFSTQDPSLDLLTLNYCRMASSVLGIEISPPHVSDAFRQQVRRRQTHDRRSATVDYVNKLADAEPARAMEELAVLVDSAWAAVHDDEAPEREYISAIVNVATSIDDAVFEDEFAATRETLRQLLRRLHSDAPDLWRDIYLLLLERMLELGGTSLGGNLSESGLLEEIDFVLLDSWDAEGMIRRIEYRRRAAWASWSQPASEDVTKYMALEIQELVGYVEQNLNPDEEQRADLVVATADMSLLLGDLSFKQSHFREALDLYLNVTSLVGSEASDLVESRLDCRRIAATAHSSIALRFSSELVEPHSAAQHGLRAIEAQPGMLLNASRFLQMCKLFSSPLLSDGPAFNFVSKYFNQPLDRAHRGPFAGTLSLRPALVVDLIEQLTELAKLVPESLMLAVGGAALRILESAKVRLLSFGEPSPRLKPRAAKLVEVLTSCGESGVSSEILAVATRLVDLAFAIDEKLQPREH